MKTNRPRASDLKHGSLVRCLSPAAQTRKVMFVFQVKGRTLYPMSGATACFMMSLANALAGFLESGPNMRFGSQTARGLYIIEIEPIDLWRRF